MMLGTGTSSTNFVNPGARVARPVGTLLPVLDGSYLPAYAWRQAVYQWIVTGAGSGPPVWDSPQFGDGFHIGDGIDYYMVYGGSLGDTVEIESATYVLSGLINSQGLTGQGPTSPIYVAVPVE
jgi:hypothetical protein